MRKISPETKAILKRDVYMKRCCLCGRLDVEWHHAVEYQGRQSDDPKSIMPLCKGCHANADDKLIKEEIEWCAFTFKGLDPKDYPKSGLEQRKKYLIRKYGY